MTNLVQRTCTNFEEGSGQNDRGISEPFADFQHLPAFVLLGEPGMGKTTAFEEAANSSNAQFITAGDLISLEVRPQWRNKTLFIDGLDEIRAGSSDGRSALNQVRAQLERLGRPRFRLSCREADWYGWGDREKLRAVSPGGEVAVLHLDSLTRANVLEILAQDSRVTDAQAFVKAAERNGVEDLLLNPQILDMLIEAVQGERWPSTRREALDLACRSLVREHNQEHLDARRAQPNNENAILDAASYLCALQLIAGANGFSVTPGNLDDKNPYLGEIAYSNTQFLYEAARTKLFKRMTGRGERATPIHRMVTEYLGARYLAELIDSGQLPVGRILALITGRDGHVVSGLRGLMAWMAALCNTQRRTIIERDPLGVVLYGDVHDLAPQDKRFVLENLEKDTSLYRAKGALHWRNTQFGGLATPDMEEPFREILSSTNRSNSHQTLVSCVLEAMAYGDKIEPLNKVLVQTIRDTTWWPGIRRQALKALQRNLEGHTNQVTILKGLLDEIGSGVIDDPDDGLLGSLLTELYPENIQATEVLDYLHVPKDQALYGGYLSFWRHKLIDRSSDSDVEALLDALSARKSEVQIVLDHHLFRDLPVKILDRGLRTFGETSEAERIFDWLDVSLNKYGLANFVDQDLRKSICGWIENHPELYKKTIEIGVRRFTASSQLERDMFAVEARLFRAKLPSDFGIWSLDQLSKSTDDTVARYFLQRAVATLWLDQGNEGLTLETIQATVAGKPKYQSWLDGLLVCPIDPSELSFWQEQRKQEAEERCKKLEWVRDLKLHEEELREGRCRSVLLDSLATAYFGYFVDAEGDSPPERLHKLLDGDEELVQSVISGLISTVYSDSIPSASSIIELHAKGERYHFSRPFRAGLEQLHQTSPDTFATLNETQIRQAVAFQLTDGMAADPGWYRQLTRTHPELVAETLVAYGKSSFRSKKEHIHGIYELANSRDFEKIAKLAALQLLKAFPARSTNQQLGTLDDLLQAALHHADKDQFLRLIEEKLELRSLNMGQRVRWLAAGLIASPDSYLDPFTEFISKGQKHVEHLTEFAAGRMDQWLPLGNLPVPVLEVLIQAIGKSYAPYHLRVSGWVSGGMRAADFVRGMITQLGSRPDQEAADCLEALVAEPHLDRWRSALQDAQFQQRAEQREASFQHPTIRQVSEVLNNRAPANTGDLAALTVEIIRNLADRIRNGNTDDYKQYWNEGHYRKLERPKSEDACQDALLSDLQERMGAHGIDATPEGHYADDKRADIRVAFGGTAGFAVPIEIKKNTHEDLWHAIHNQLISKYSREPLAQGFGIYLVFWFGVDNQALGIKQPPPPDGPRPKTAAELANRLRASLSPENNRKISICVIDVSAPR